MNDTPARLFVIVADIDEYDDKGTLVLAITAEKPTESQIEAIRAEIATLDAQREAEGADWDSPAPFSFPAPTIKWGDLHGWANRLRVTAIPVPVLALSQLPDLPPEA